MAIRTALFSEDRASSAKVIGGSLKFNSGDSQCLTYTPGSSGDLRKMTFSFWIKRSEPGAYQSVITAYNGSNTDRIQFTSDDQFMIELKNGGSTEAEFHSDRVFRDPNAWYHFVVAFDTEDNTTADRCKAWVNGEQITDWDTNDTIGQNYDMAGFNVSGKQHGIGRYENGGSGTYYWDGHITEFHFVNDAQLEPTEFGYTDPLTNTWRPKQYTGSHGTTGYYLPFDGSAPIGDDQSGNGLDWKPTKFQCSAGFDKATGAFPILNTVNGGTMASVGLRSDSYAPGQLVFAAPFCGIRTDVAYQANGGVNAHPLSMTGSLPGDDQNRVEPQNFYGPAFYFDGNDCVYAPDSADFTLGTGDFTAEAWIKRNRTGSDEWFFVQGDGTSANTSFGIHIDSSTNYLEGRVRDDTTDANVDIAGNTAMGTNVWYHCAWVRDGATLRLFLNGVQENTYNIGGNTVVDADSDADLCIGAVNAAGSAGFQGWMQDVRLYKGVCKYKTNFIPASPNPDILLDTPSGSAYKTPLEKISTGSVHFDGSTQFMALTNSSSSIGQVPFTIEFWMRPTRETSGNYNRRVILNAPNNTTGSFSVCYNTSTHLVVFNYNSSTLFSSQTQLAEEKWYHVAIVREGNSTNETHMYIDGKLEAEGTMNTDFTHYSYQFGTDTSLSQANYSYSGFISNLRIVSGTAVYTSNFKPPTEPLTNISGTKILTFTRPNIPVSFASRNTEAVVTGVCTQYGNPNYNVGLGTTGTVWSDSGTQNTSGVLLGDAFNGDLTDFYGGQNGTSGWYTYTFPHGGVPFKKCEIAGSNYNGLSTKVNGTTRTDWGTTYNPAPWHDVSSVITSPLTSMSVYANGSGQTSTISAVRIDGKVLVDGAIDTFVQPTNPFTAAEGGIESNYCTLNPNDSKSASFSNGNLTVTQSADPAWARGTMVMAPNTGKWYYEMTPTAGASYIFGMQETSAEIGSWGSYAITYYGYNGNKRLANTSIAYGDSFTSGVTVGICYDSTNATVEFFRNGVSQGIAFTSVAEHDYLPFIYLDNYGTTPVVNFNFGQKSFRFAPPHGSKTLCVDNMVRPTITRSDAYFKAVTYAGTGSVLRVYGLNFKPDMVWIKNRSQNDSHVIQDVVRGNWIYYPNDDTGGGATGGGWVRKMLYNGFEVDANDPINTNSENFVGWCWKAGGDKGTFNIDGTGHSTAAAAGLTGGDLDPSGASIGTEQGFSIITYTGNGSSNQSIKHGLTKAPEVMIIKRFGGTGYWDVTYTFGDGTFDFLMLDVTDAKADITGRTAPTSSLMYVSGAGSNDANGETYCAYSWHSVPGFSKFGRYTGNDNDPDGPTIYLGFRPAFIIIKCDSNAEAWGMYDSARDTDNVLDKRIQCNANTEEQSGDADRKIDFLSNGFRIIGDDGELNTDNYTYLYMAWAETPLNTLYGGQSNAR